MSIEFGPFLKKARKDTGFSQRELAALLGIDHTYLSKIENSKMPTPSAETVMKIARVLGRGEYEFLSVAGFCTSCNGSGRVKQ